MNEFVIVASLAATALTTALSLIVWLDRKDPPR